MQKSIIAAVGFVVLAGLVVAAYVTLRPAPADAPAATSATPAATSTPQATATTTASEQPPATTTPAVEHPATNTPPETQALPPTPSTSSLKTYRNEEWGFSFQYPEDWHLEIPGWGSKVSKFNMSLWPTEGKHLPDPIFVNVTSKEWIERAIEAMKAQRDVVEDAIVNGRAAVRYESTNSGIPSVGYIFYVDNIQINLEGKQDDRYLKAFADVLDSFVITATSTPTN